MKSFLLPRSIIVSQALPISGAALLAAMLLGANRTPAEEPTREIALGDVQAAGLYAVTVSIQDPAQLSTKNSIEVELRDGQGVLCEKALHGQDLDLYATVRARQNGPLSARLRTDSKEDLSNISASMRAIPHGD